MKLKKNSVLVISGMVFLLGCGAPATDYSMVDLVKGYGKVTLDGNALADAVVIFEDATDETISYAKTDSGGNYKLQFDSDMAGVKTGKKIVRISTTRKLLGLSSEPGEGESDGDPDDVKSKPVELVPDKYNKDSELVVEVVRGKTQYDFDLVSK